ncbi:MAG: hypothetical protein ACRDSS_07100 [Actinocrinis sp.]
MTHLDELLGELCQPRTAAPVDHAAEVLAVAAESASALAELDEFDTATLWWAAGTLSSAYAALLPHTKDDPPGLPTVSSLLPGDADRLVELLRATVDLLDRTARKTDDPDRLYALSRAADLTDQGRRAIANAKAGTR